MRGARAAPPPSVASLSFACAMRLAVILLAVLSLTCVDAMPAIGASSTRRILLLHGTGASAGAFLNSPTKRGAKGFLAGVPAEGVWNSNAAWNANGQKTAAWNWHISAVDAQGPDGNWFSEDGSFRGADESIAHIEAEIEERKITGVVGFEQGGQLAALLAARASLGEGSAGLQRLRFAILCSAGGIASAGSPYMELLEQVRDAPEADVLPTLHCASRSDAICPPELTQDLAACFGASAELLWHEMGHAMPPRDWYKQSGAFIERAWDREGLGQRGLKA